MFYDPPTPQATLPTETVGTLNGYSADQIHHAASYVEALAEHKVCEARLEEESEDDEICELSDDLSDDIPAEGMIKIKAEFADDPTY